MTRDGSQAENVMIEFGNLVNRSGKAANGMTSNQHDVFTQPNYDIKGWIQDLLALQMVFLFCFVFTEKASQMSTYFHINGSLFLTNILGL